MKKYKVYESNAGNLTLIAYNKDGHADYIHTGYEFVSGQLKQDLQAVVPRKGDVDRNMHAVAGFPGSMVVPRKGDVDRNHCFG